ncbi:MAG: hypothetical protein KIT31_09050 [Deltaproteobacteria bacterium]|nr:hypothetical protein [Deltaproteobacteria bacterium]
MRRALSLIAILATAASCGDNDLQAEIDDLTAQLAATEAELAQTAQQRDTFKQERDAIAGALAALEAKVNPVISLEVPFVFGAEALELNKAYPVAGGDTLSFREVRYWLTGVALERPDHSFVDVPDGYYLVEARPEQPLTNGTESALMLPATRREAISFTSIPSGTYVGIRFHIGVDPAHNDDLSRTAGELHTLKNMTSDNGWMWFTSYIFTKTRADLAGPGGAAVVSWDNGSNDDLREVHLAFPSAIETAAAVAYKVRVKADLKTLADAVAPRQRVVIGAGTPGDRSLLADAFRDMFVLESAAAVP